jgi:hypothetical protein
MADQHVTPMELEAQVHALPEEMAIEGFIVLEAQPAAVA